MNRIRFGLILVLAGATTMTPSTWAAEPAETGAKEYAQDIARSFFERRFEYEQLDGEVTLIENGEATCAIVVPVGSAPPVEFASYEIQHYLRKITGAEVPIVKLRPAEGAAIVLGDGPDTRRAGIKVDQLARDGCQIVVRDQTIYIAGRDDNTERARNLFVLRDKPHKTPTGHHDWDFNRGTLYGAYRFLEELGVRWFMPTEAGEAVPETGTGTLTVQSFRALEEPAFDLRCFGPPDWSLSRIRKKSGTIHLDEYKWLGYRGYHNQQFLLRARASSAWYAFNHRPPRVEFEERFGKTHPEYFALLGDGSRDLEGQRTGRTGHLCYTNQGMFEETARDIDAFFAGKPAAARGIAREMDSATNGWSPAVAYGNTVTMLPHDSFPPRACVCENCRPLHRRNADYLAQHSNLVWPFIARVGEYVRQNHPGRVVTCLAYASFSIPPTNLDRLPDTVMVGICPHYLNKTIHLVTPSRYERYMDLTRQWAKLNEMPLLFWQHHLVRYHVSPENAYGVPALYPRLFGDYFRDISKYGRMMYMACAVDSLVYEHLNRYIGFRMMLNPGQDIEALLDDYFIKFYGPGAKVAKSLFDDIEKSSIAIAQAMPKDERYIPFPPSRTWSDEFIGPATLEKYRQQADDLVRLTKGTRHERAAELVSRFLVGRMEKASARAIEQQAGR